jgi:uncharacterized OsmC-like protein
MDSQALKDLQAPLKQQYRDRPESAMVTLRAAGRLGEGLTCKLDTGRAMVEAGLHPATGGDGLAACSGDMLLEALVACAGVTLRAVATAMGIELRDGRVLAEGDLDFRGTLGVAKEALVGFREIRLAFEVDSDAASAIACHAAAPDGALLRRLPGLTQGPRRAALERHRQKWKAAAEGRRLSLR